MNDLLLQLIIVVAVGAFCFGCGYLVAFIVTRMKWRREMIRRGAARYNSQTGKWEWGEPPEKPQAWKVQ
jgi:heme/copper-type cytochrome/quinol oxidase subunit 1